MLNNINELLSSDDTYGSFMEQAPAYNRASELITGRVCGVRVVTIEDPLMRRVRQLDKLVDELARGWPKGCCESEQGQRSRSYVQRSVMNMGALACDSPVCAAKAGTHSDC